MKKIYLLVLLGFISLPVFSQLNIQFRSQLPYPGLALANIWGYVDSLGNEYALVGTSTGVSIVNVTNPNSPVQVYAVTGTTSQWREIKTWGKYAYVTTEGCCLGLQIINLSNLPGPVTSSYWTGSGAIAGLLTRSHSLHIDNGYLYLNGSNLFGGACIIASLSNPTSPVYMSNTSLNFAGNIRYVHDCYVRNDTMYGSNIYAGMFTIINVTNKSTPILINTQSTTNNFTHNCWLTDDGRTLLTTDETSNSYLTAYDISNPANIVYKDKVQSNPGSNSIVHNTYVRNDFAITSWYKDGVAIIDAARPDNLIITGTYDTYSQGAGNGFNGCWGVYPYLPSGNILASDINNGLFVLTPTYVRACYLEGTVKNSCNGVGVSGVTVQITGGNSDASIITGSYKTGTAVAGNYTVTFSKAGFNNAVFNNVTLTNGVVTSLNVTLFPVGAITAVNPVVTDVLCNGQNNGQVLTSPAGGVLPLAYQWSDGSTNQTLGSVSAGTYTVIVTDATGCSLSSVSTINQPAPLIPSPTTNSPVCAGSALTLSSASGFNSYTWTGPNYSSALQNNTIAFASGIANGNYTLVVTDNNGCSNSQTIPIQVSEISFSSLVSNVKCYNTASASINIGVSGGIGAYSYLWNNNAVTEDLANIPVGNYTVNVTDGLGCSKSTSFTITQPATALNVSTAKTNVRCYGASTGQASVKPTGGMLPYSYSWNTTPVNTTNIIMGVAAGSYIATVTDAAGCIKTFNINITQPPNYFLIQNQSNVSIYGGTNGTASITVVGGTAPYTYFWYTSPVQTTSTLSNLGAGVYKCKVTDNKGCLRYAYFTITQPPPVRYFQYNKPTEPKVYPNPAQDVLYIKDMAIDLNYLFSLYDVEGRQIQSGEIRQTETTQIPLSGVEAGIYFMVIKNHNESFNFKIVVN